MSSPTDNIQDTATDLEPGRHIVLEPLPAGMWQILLGAIAAVLGPLFGFLAGSIMGKGEPDAAVNPMFLALFIGIMIGGIGTVVALLGVLRLLRRQARTDADEEAAEEAAADGLPPTT